MYTFVVQFPTVCVCVCVYIYIFDRINGGNR